MLPLKNTKIFLLVSRYLLCVELFPQERAVEILTPDTCLFSFGSFFPTCLSLLRVFAGVFRLTGGEADQMTGSSVTRQHTASGDRRRRSQ